MHLKRRDINVRLALCYSKTDGDDIESNHEDESIPKGKKVLICIFADVDNNKQTTGGIEAEIPLRQYTC